MKKQDFKRFKRHFIKKNKFIYHTFILMIGAIFTKLLGMVIRILTSRILTDSGIGLYSYVMPTFMLGITLCQLGLPIAISKIVAEEKVRSKNLILRTILICMVLDIIFIFIFYFSSSFIATYLLKEKRCKLAISSIGFVLPFISISSILRGYYLGKEKMWIHVISNIGEDIVRLILIFFFLPLMVGYSLEVAIWFLIISNIFSELLSIILFLIFIPKSKLEKKDFSFSYSKEVFNISIPITTSRLLSNACSFLEPIILSYFLIKDGYSSSYIMMEYGVINGYVMPIILLPSFFTLAISQAMIPQISKNYICKKYKNCIKKIQQACLLSFILSFLFTAFIFIFPSSFLMFLYHTKKGVSYLRVLSIIFFIYYIQNILSASLHAISSSKTTIYATLISVIVKIFLIIIFSYFHFGMWSYIFSFFFSMLLSTWYEFHVLTEKLTQKKEEFLYTSS